MQMHQCWLAMYRLGMWAWLNGDKSHHFKEFTYNPRIFSEKKLYCFFFVFFLSSFIFEHTPVEKTVNDSVVEYILNAHLA